MTIAYDGTVHQSAHVYNQNDYEDEKIYFPVLGIILDVKAPDDPTNKSNKKTADQIGSRLEATVLVTNSGMDASWIIPNVPVLPQGACGIDNFHEETPRPCTQLINGSSFNGNLSHIDHNLLDGDKCIISFVGGMINQPIMTHWFPHPGNTFDPATGGIADGALSQLPRLFKRFNGVKYTITNKGNVYFDTTDAGSINTTIDGQFIRKATQSGGDITLNVKEGAGLLVNFNAPAPLPITEPSLRQANGPSASKIDGDLNDIMGTFTSLSMSKNDFTLVAGEAINIGTKETVEISAPNIKFGTNLESISNEDDQFAINTELVKIFADTKTEVNSPNIELNAGDLTSIIMSEEFISAVAQKMINLVADEKIEINSVDVRLGVNPESQTALNQVVVGSYTDPFSGQTALALGGTSPFVKATK
jgi:hypothetical protein